VDSFDIATMALAILGIVISAGGFGLTLHQVRKTRSAVEAAEGATREALKGLSGRLTISEVADMRAAIRGIQTALRGERFETALIQTQGIVEQLNGLRMRTGFESDARHTEIQNTVVQLAKLRNRLEERIANPSVQLSTAKANNMLSELGGTLSSWTEELHFRNEAEEA
jgi:hypothetical protein